MQRTEGRLRSAPRNPVLPLALAICAAAATIGAATHKASGVVISVDRATGVMVVSHREIPGFMPAMSMPVRVDRAAELNGVEPGARIRFDLVVGAAQSRARNVQVEREAPLDFVPPPAPNRLPIGSPVPDFELTDQHGAAFRLSDSAGKPVAIQFLYTRCPLPDVCPRQAAHFAYADRRLAGKVTLVSITLDSQHDTPAELTAYAARWKASPSWRFLTGPDAAVQRVAEQFGVVYWPEEGAISHSSATAIIGVDGRLKAVLDGSSHRAQQLLHLIENQLR